MVPPAAAAGNRARAAPGMTARTQEAVVARHQG